ncbi:aldehyde dehydrogenase family protein [Paucilactobacillus hokkaidonensis]|uniref:aldehyde dehydrogenase family protein n=1 Tax=Paucilactobacillus hokkaidonensis TaxID=1193095 RepID=UPI000A81E6F0|nr:aldehyde dehydrogenase family protein [Paucilactobacillus hokkaidonensis]
MKFDVLNPYSATVEETFTINDQQSIEARLTRASRYYEDAKQISFTNRARQLHAIATAFRENAEQLAETATQNMGKLLQESLQEVNAAANIADYYADKGPSALQPKDYQYQGDKRAKLTYTATGIVLAIEPWNFPYTQVMRVFAPNFLLGNPVLLKHAKIVAGCAAAFEQTVWQAQVEHGAFQNLFVTNEQIKNIIEDQRVQGVALTGSTKAGRIVASEAAQALTKTTLELGGNDAFIVLPGADIEQAAKDAATSRLRNSGQVCTSAKRLIVHKAVAEEFTLALMREFEARQMGDPMNTDTSLAPLASQEIQTTLQKQVDSAIQHGAHELIHGGIVENKIGNFFSPVLLTDIDEANPIFDEELFGPVGQIHVVESGAAAIKLANQSQYGLAGAVYSGSTERAKKVAQQLETGQVFINQPSNGYLNYRSAGLKTLATAER